MRLRSPYWLFVVLILALAGLQYRLWVGDGSLAQVRDLQKRSPTSMARTSACWSATGFSKPKSPS